MQRLRYDFIIGCWLLAMLPLAGLQGQSHLPVAAGGRGLAMGQTRLLSRSVWATVGNQAGLSGLKTPQVAVMGRNWSGLAMVSQVTAVAAVPVQEGALGLQLQHLGTADYREQKIGLSYARPFAERLHVGIQLDYLGLQLGEYGRRGLLTFEGGVLLDLNAEWTVAAHLFSPVAVAWNEWTATQPALALGAGYRASDKIQLVAEVEQVAQSRINARLGLDYQVLEVLALRVGATTYPAQQTFGVGLKVGALRIDAATVLHGTLGAAGGMSVRYDFE